MDLSPFITTTENDDGMHAITFDEAAWRKAFVAERARMTKRGMQLKAEKGELPGCAPVGYLNKREGDRTWVEVDSVKGPLVREAFALAATGRYSLRDQCAIMAGKGLLSLRGNPLGASGLHYLLTNPFYTGKILYSTKFSLGRHDPLVNDKTFLRVQNLLSKRYKHRASISLT